MTISYYEKMPDGKLHCLDDQLPFELPDGWEWCNLSMIGTTNIGLTYRPTNIEPDGVIVLRSCNIVNDQVDLSDLVRVKTTIRENQYVQKNDILICARNGSRALVGKCALIPDLGEPASFGAFMAIIGQSILSISCITFVQASLEVYSMTVTPPLSISLHKIC